MKLKLKNIGKLQETEIDIDGITVIAGKNNTGKSTVGKSLYCIFSSMYDVNQKIEDDKKDYVRRRVEILFMQNYSSITNRLLFKHTYKDIIENIVNDIIDKQNNEAKELILMVFNQLNEKRKKNNNFDSKTINDEILNEFFQNIQEGLDIPKQIFYINRLNNIIYKEFNGQINNINNKLGSTINLLIKENRFKMDIKGEKITINQYMELESDIVYIDNPFVLDNIDDKDLQDILNHRDNIISKMKNNIQDDNMTENILLQEKVTSVIDKLDKIGVGKLIKIKEMYQTKFKYQSSLDNEPLEFVNVSAGLKTFIILKTLILNGHIKERGCIVLDEPEIHLHPEWQLVFAELIVLLTLR